MASDRGRNGHIASVVRDLNGRSGAERRGEPFVGAEPIVFGAPSIGEEEIEEVIHTLRSGWIGTGPKTRQFEYQFADYVGATSCVATNSGTAALHLALDGLDIGPGDEVITTPLTFAATANVIEHVGARPVFVDVREHDGNIDPHEVAAARTSETKAVIIVHYAGAAADLRRVSSLLPNIPIVVDAAHAIETTYPNGSRSAEGGAAATAYSFYATKNLTTGEGGMLATDDENLAHRARVRSLHGLNRDAWNRYSTSGIAGYSLEYPGYKHNMTDMQASLGIHQLARIERNHRRRCEIWTRYNEAFAECDGLELLQFTARPDQMGRHARHLYTLLIDWTELKLDRAELDRELREAGIGTGWHFPPLHLERWYADTYGYARGDFPVAESIAERTISIPMSPALLDADVERVIDTVCAVLRHNQRHLLARPRRLQAVAPDPTLPVDPHMQIDSP